MTASLAASSPVLRRPLLSFAVRSDFLLKPRISARSEFTSRIHLRHMSSVPLTFSETANSDAA